MGGGASKQPLVDVDSIIEMNRQLIQMLSQRILSVNGDGNAPQTGGISYTDNRVMETRIGTNYEDPVTIHHHHTAAVSGPDVDDTPELGYRSPDLDDELGSGAFSTGMPFAEARTAVIHHVAEDAIYWPDLVLDWEVPMLPAEPQTVNLLVVVIAALSATLLSILGVWVVLARRHGHRQSPDASVPSLMDSRDSRCADVVEFVEFPAAPASFQPLPRYAEATRTDRK